MSLYPLKWLILCQSFSKSSKKFEEAKLILWGQRDPDTKAKTGHYQKRKLQANTLMNIDAKTVNKILLAGASLVAQWLRIHLPIQGTQFRALVWEDPTCCGATKPVHHNYWACALEPTSHNYWARVLQLLKPAHLEPTLRNKRSHCNEKPVHRNEE